MPVWIHHQPEALPTVQHRTLFEALIPENFWELVEQQNIPQFTLVFYLITHHITDKIIVRKTVTFLISTLIFFAIK